MEQNQLAIINFSQLQIPIYGTVEEPLVKCSDLLIHVLKYQKSRDANWFKNISCQQRQLYLIEQGGDSPSFNEQGIYWALMKSNKPIAQEFQFEVCKLLKSIRKQQLDKVKETQQELEAARKEIEELKQPRLCSVYKIYHNDELLYIGKDTSKNQNRVQQHFTERRKIASQNQIIDIYLASLSEQEIVVKQEYCMDDQVDQLEQFYIQTENPLYNQTYNNKEYRCQTCQKKYTSRACYEKHIQKHNQ